MSRISDLAGFTTAISTTEDLSVGIITASSFSGNLTGDVTGTATGLAAGATGSDLTLSGNLSIGGTLTYQDVTNVDAVGMVTARKGLQVLADGLDVTGVGTFKSNVSIADSVIHTGDTDTAIRFPAADTFTVETSGSEALRVDSSQRLLLGTTTEGEPNADNLTIADSGNCGLTLRSGSSNVGSIYFSDATSGNAEYDGYIDYNQSTSLMRFGTASDTRVVIDSSGRLLQGTTTEGAVNADDLTIATSGDTGITIRSADDGYGNLFFSDGTSGAAEYAGYVQYNHNNNSLVLGANSSTRLSITSTGGVNFNNGELIERVNITAGKLSDNQNINLDNGMVHLFTTTETATSTPNIISTAGINTSMATGDALSVNIITTTAAAAYSERIKIDGLLTGITTSWNGGSAPSAGGASGKDFYSYTIIKTGDAAYTVLGNLSNFA
jgi:hypothetical protein